MRSVELFAGCGGLALGLSQAGFDPVAVIENDPQAVTTLKANAKSGRSSASGWPVLEQDVREIDFKSYKSISLVSGGPPCQPFSIGGKHLGQKDERNMWPEAIRAVREIMPRAFVFENVRGLLRPAFKRYLDYIKKQLEYPHVTKQRGESWPEHLGRLRRYAASSRSSEPAYRVIVQGINTADYGAPQKRYRTIIMGVSLEFGEDWSFPKETRTQEALVWSKHISGEYWDRHGIRPVNEPSSNAELQLIKRLKSEEVLPRGRAWKTARDALGDLPPPSKRDEPLQGHWQHPGACTYDNHTGSDWDEPAKALKAGDHGVPGGENMVCNRRGTPRYFTIREMARLQSLPDSYVIEGSWKAATRQLGNALPSVVGKRFGKHIAEIIG